MTPEISSIDCHLESSQQQKDKRELQGDSDLETNPIMISTDRCATKSTTTALTSLFDSNKSLLAADQQTNGDEGTQEELLLKQFANIQLDDLLFPRTTTSSRRRASVDDEFLRSTSALFHNPTISRPNPKTCTNAPATANQQLTEANFTWSIPRAKPQQTPSHQASLLQQTHQISHSQFMAPFAGPQPYHFEPSCSPNTPQYGSLMLNGPNTGGASSLTTDKRIALYKTEMCRTFEETGTCRYGIKCQFAHDPSELRRVQRHPRYKTEICKTFWHLGNCPYGKRCCFIHTENEIVLASDTETTATNSNFGHSTRSLKDSPKKAGINEIKQQVDSKLLPRIQTVASSLPATTFDAFQRRKSVLEEIWETSPRQETCTTPNCRTPRSTTRRLSDPLFESLSHNSSSDDGGAQWEDEDPLGLVPYDIIKGVRA